MFLHRGVSCFYEHHFESMFIRTLRVRAPESRKITAVDEKLNAIYHPAGRSFNSNWFLNSFIMVVHENIF